MPTNFESISLDVSKTPVLVLQIEGLDDILSSATVYTRIVYGDPLIHYGGTDPVTGMPWVYGGLRVFSNADGSVSRSYLMLEGSSLAITQKVEQEQGRCSISQMTFAFIDKDSYMTRLITPGMLIPEPLGAQITVLLGYQEISYPQDYITIFRGNIQGITSQAGRVILELGDPNLKKRQSVFYTAQTTLGTTIDDSVTTIPVTNNGDFYQQILGPSGISDPGVKTYIQIDDEWIEYNREAYKTNSFNQIGSGIVTRGARGTIAAAHTIGASVSVGIEIAGNVVDLMLKIMLSGWNGYYMTDQPILSIVYTGDASLGNVTNGILLPANVDAVFDLGLNIGDYVTITGDANPSNNVTGVVTGFTAAFSEPNRVIIINQTLVISIASTATLSLRSQYDTLPIDAGLKLFPYEVDVETHRSIRANYLSADSMNFFITETENSGKTFIEKELALPVSAYCITKSGQISLKLTLPPIADQTLKTLDKDNVIEPQNIKTQRSTTIRKFFNEIQYDYNPSDLGTFQNTARFINTDSLNEIGYTSSMPIQTRGTRSGAGIQKRAERLLDRYNRGAVLIYLKVNYGTGNDINPGDIIILTDNGNLQISNMSTGVRDIGTQLYEVIERTFDFRNGNTSLTLLSGINFGLQDRFATWSPASIIQNATSTTTQIKIIPSYGAFYGLSEYLKWENYIGLNVRIRNKTYTFDETTRLVSVSSTNVLTLSPPLSITPLDGYIVELDKYSTSSDPSFQQTAKVLHVFWDKTAIITGVTNTTTFTVSAPDSAYFRVGYPLVVKTPTGSTYSEEVLITSVVGTTITCEMLSYLPNIGDECELLSFDDGGQPYRWI